MKKIQKRIKTPFVIVVLIFIGRKSWERNETKKVETDKENILVLIDPWSRHVELYVDSQDDKNMLYPDMIYDLDNAH